MAENNLDPQATRVVEAACWADTRRKFFDLARLHKAPIAGPQLTRDHRLSPSSVARRAMRAAGRSLHELHSFGFGRPIVLANPEIVSPDCTVFLALTRS